MGAGSRRYAAVMAPIIGLAPEREAEAERALGILTDAALEPIVDMVLPVCLLYTSDAADEL